MITIKDLLYLVEVSEPVLAPRLFLSSERDVSMDAFEKALLHCPLCADSPPRLTDSKGKFVQICHGLNPTEGNEGPSQARPIQIRSAEVFEHNLGVC